MIGQLSLNGNGCKTGVKFVLSHWPVSIYLLIVKLVIRVWFVGFVYDLDKSFVRHQYLLTSVQRHLFKVSLPAFQSQSLKNSLY